MEIVVRVEEKDALNVNADVLILKFAQDLMGVDYSAFFRLETVHPTLGKKLPKPNNFLIVESRGTIGPANALFCGVIQILEFRYKEIREFAYNALKYLHDMNLQVQHICMTLHGAAYGLDEIEAFESEIGGLAEAVAKGFYPPSLQKITIAEIFHPRAERLKAVLTDFI